MFKKMYLEIQLMLRTIDLNRYSNVLMNKAARVFWGERGHRRYGSFR